MKKLILSSLSLGIVCLAFLGLPQTIQAVCPSDITNNYCYAQGCDITGSECVEHTTPYGSRFCGCAKTLYNTDPNNPFGTITNPLPTSNTTPGGGLIVLLNNVLRLVFVVAGIYAFLRIILAGLAFVGAGGDAKKIEAAWNSIWQALLGLVIIVSSFAIAVLVGQLLFGNAMSILNPQIYGPGG